MSTNESEGIPDRPEFGDPAAVRVFLENLRWPDGVPTCPHCRKRGHCYRLAASPAAKVREGLWKCGGCRKQFTVTVKTTFDSSKLPLKLPLNAWLLAVYVWYGAERPSLQLLRTSLGVTARTAAAIRSRLQFSYPRSARVGTRLEVFQRALVALLQPRSESPERLDRYWSDNRPV